MPTSKTIYFGVDGYKLVGTLHLPDAPEPPVVIGCHGLFANRHSPKQLSLASACNQIGIAYFRFDHRGCGDSQGEFTTLTSLAARCQDLYHAVQTMQNQSNLGPLVTIFGSSFGGTVVLAHAAEHPAPALITYAAPINSTNIQLANIRENNGTPPASALLTDALAFDITPRLRSISNVLICHSHGDETVPVNHAQEIFKHAQAPKHIHLFENGDHRMSTVSHQKQFESMCSDWIIQFQSHQI